jgi:hypothetical protein
MLSEGWGRTAGQAPRSKTASRVASGQVPFDTSSPFRRLSAGHARSAQTDNSHETFVDAPDFLCARVCDSIS